MRRHGRGPHHMPHFVERFHGVPRLNIAQQEVLEQILAVEEKGLKITPRQVRDVMHIPNLGMLLADLESFGLVLRARRQISLSEAGRREATLIKRRNRLAEVLFNQVFEMPLEKSKELACKFEHIAISSDVTDSICTFLGHPPTCPHGRPIPPGECCKTGRKELKPIIKRLSDLKLGDSGRVVFVKHASHSLMDKLGSLGILPGTVLHLHQKKPSIVIQYEGTTMALEDDVADDIYVRIREEDENKEK